MQFMSVGVLSEGKGEKFRETELVFDDKRLREKSVEGIVWNFA